MSDGGYSERVTLIGSALSLLVIRLNKCNATSNDCGVNCANCHGLP